MFTRAALSFSPQCGQVRNMATLKEISMRLKSVKSIQKITKSMKMVSAAKYSRAEKELKPARPYGVGAQAFFEKSDVQVEDPKPATLLVAITSDRGLCGAVHSSIVKEIRRRMATSKNPESIKIAIIGDKARLMLSKQFPQNILFCINDVGKQAPQFGDAAKIAETLLDCGVEFDVGSLIYNQFKSVISYNTKEMPVYSLDMVSNAGKINLYDSIDDEVLQSYNEFALASLTYFCMKEGSASEQSARMTAMDGASKNAGEMIDKLTMTFNRTRQAVITRELIEIISGAAALK